MIPSRAEDYRQVEIIVCDLLKNIEKDEVFNKVLQSKRKTYINYGLKYLRDTKNLWNDLLLELKIYIRFNLSSCKKLKLNDYLRVQDFGNLGSWCWITITGREDIPIDDLIKYCGDNIFCKELTKRKDLEQKHILNNMHLQWDWMQLTHLVPKSIFFSMVVKESMPVNVAVGSWHIPRHFSLPEFRKTEYSLNACELQSFIKKYGLKDTLWNVCGNTFIPVHYLENNKGHIRWDAISVNKNYTWDIITRNSGLPWRYKLAIDQNPNSTVSELRKYEQFFRRLCLWEYTLKKK